MSTKTETIQLSQVIFRQDLYPRIEHDPALVQRYAANIEQLPPIEVNQHYELIDGWHRWTAHKKVESETIEVQITETKSEAELLALAIRRNASHGKQLEEKDKESMAHRLHRPSPSRADGFSDKEIAEILSVSVRMVGEYLREDKKREKKERNEKIRAMWLACHTQEEIAEAVGIHAKDKSLQVSSNLEELPNYCKLAATYQDADWQPPIYDIWNFADNANETKHFGNTHIGIVDNLLYLFTEPFDIVVDPFAVGGSTIDICKKRLRRFYVADRKPIPEREADIRKEEVSINNLVGPSRWKDVSLVYLDPPYWRQAEGQYSDAAEDLGNMPLEQFTETMVSIIAGYAKKMRTGSHIAMIIQPTQWKADDRQTVYHDRDIDFALRRNKKLRLDRVISCPYSTQQYTPQMVEAAKADKMNLVLTRTMLVWEVQ